VNPTWDEIVDRDPLVAFSWYLSGRKSVLLSIGAEIIDNLDHAFSGAVINGALTDRAESLMWLWTLGAYEVVRTMCQAKICFSKRAFDELTQLKQKLSSVRMPAAKMEKPGKKQPVTSDRSPSEWDLSNRDLFLGDPESTTRLSARFILAEFDRVFSSISKAEVLGHHAESYFGNRSS